MMRGWTPHTLRGRTPHTLPPSNTAGRQCVTYVANDAMTK